MYVGLGVKTNLGELPAITPLWSKGNNLLPFIATVIYWNLGLIALAALGLHNACDKTRWRCVCKYVSYVPHTPVLFCAFILPGHGAVHW